jgi:hypothetical protein
MVQPMVSRVDTEDGDVAQKLLRIRGQNLMRQQPPKVQIAGEPVSVLQASEREILVAPKAHQFGGVLTIETEPNIATQTAFDLRPALAEASAKENGE